MEPEPKPKKPCRFCLGKGVMHPENTGAQFNCWDCKKPCGDYQLDGRIWSEAMPDYPRLKRELKAKYGGTAEQFRVTVRLCLGCVSKRLGRALIPEDFGPAAVNDVVREGVRMGMAVRGV